MALEQSLNLTCRIRSNSNSNFKRPYLGNETTNLISAGAKIPVSSRAFTYSFMKVASHYSFTLFRAEKNTFSGCSRCLSCRLSFIHCDFVTLNTIFLFSMFLLRAYRPGLTAVRQCLEKRNSAELFETNLFVGLLMKLADNNGGLQPLPHKLIRASALRTLSEYFYRISHPICILYLCHIYIVFVLYLYHICIGLVP